MASCVSRRGVGDLPDILRAQAEAHGQDIGLLAALDEARDLDIPPRDESRVACSSSDARPLCPLFLLQV